MTVINLNCYNFKRHTNKPIFFIQFDSISGSKKIIRFIELLIKHTFAQSLVQLYKYVEKKLHSTESQSNGISLAVDDMKNFPYIILGANAKLRYAFHSIIRCSYRSLYDGKC